ncbi:MAG: hypothetical protein LBS62_01540 [Clostridiales bacterium]|jgi:hypothetical protein|nr:hypothetical protein [Clostridiales bacterium]
MEKKPRKLEILVEDILIPYPEIYWTAEVFLNEPKHGGYLFSVDLDVDGNGK